MAAIWGRARARQPKAPGDASNDQIRHPSRPAANLVFVDVNPVSFDSAGRPRMELSLEDRLHLRDQGDDEMSRVLRPVLKHLWQIRPR